MSNSKYQIFDDFLDDPDEVLEFSKSSNYYTAKQYAEYNKSESIGNGQDFELRILCSNFLRSSIKYKICLM